LAAAKLRREKPGHTLEPTALVHEAYLRLVKTRQVPHWDSRGHFFAAAAEAMRRILIENARRNRPARKTGQLSQNGCQHNDTAEDFDPLDILALNEALSKLEAEHPMHAQIVKLRFVSGLTHDEIATVLDLSPITVKRYWRFSRMWLHREMQLG
jgi:RNA polymerase sigma factor (TIGR02999 family)